MLNKEFLKIEEYFDNIDQINLNVSKTSVGWHIDHSLKVINKVCETLIISNPKEFQQGFNLKRRIIFALGFFPRGKARSPKRVLPPEVILISDLKSQLEEAKSNLKNIQELEEDCFFTHPIFKKLNKKQTLKFMGLHTNHHLKIIKDIIK